MDMSRAILEGILEVELQITPEFQKGGPGGEWPEAQRNTWNMSPRIDYYWDFSDEFDMPIVRGIEFDGDKYAISWSASTADRLKGNWRKAIESLRKKDAWKQIYVYGVPENQAQEVADLVYSGPLYAVFYPNDTGDSDYDPEIVDLLKVHLLHKEDPEGEGQAEPEEGEFGVEYPELTLTPAMQVLIEYRVWASHDDTNIFSKDHPLMVTVAAVGLDKNSYIAQYLADSGMTSEFHQGEHMYYIFPSPGMDQVAAQISFMQLLTRLDNVLGWPE